MAIVYESDLEEAVLEWFRSLGYEIIHGSQCIPEAGGDRLTYGDVILRERLISALISLNPNIPIEAINFASDKLQSVTHATPTYLGNNRLFHTYITSGIDVEYSNPNGGVIYDKVWVVDYSNPYHNDFVVMNQMTIVEGQIFRRPDIVIFVNGLPLGVLELKNPSDENTTTLTAFKQLQNYKKYIPSLFAYNEILVASDGFTAKTGSLTADWERFMPWRTIDGVTLDPPDILNLETLVRGIFDKQRFLDLIRYFNVFEVSGDMVVKKMAAYHQFHAVRKAVDCAVKSSSNSGDKRVGVVWHTQGSGKSLSMVFFAAKLARHAEMCNPTLVVLTDRNDLDDQLYGTFCGATELLGQTPIQATSRDELKDLLQVGSGGIVFTTIHKFAPEVRGGKYPTLSERRNIVVMVDEAHRSQYDFIDGFAKNLRDALPNASFIGFTGTPIATTDKNTVAVFGNYIDIYDIQQAVEDNATVRIFYEGRLAKLELDGIVQPKLDAEFEEVTETEELEGKEKLKSKWARLEAVVGAEKRIKLIAQNIVDHFESRQAVMKGKAMIVCMSRRICVDLYDAIVKLRPDWHHSDDDKGVIKVIMTGSAADKVEFLPHIRPKARRESLRQTYVKPESDFQIVIVRDMWLTGFDAPCMHTMYMDKPMHGSNLMQAIARVNRVFKDKPGGLIVDYLGLADQLKLALADYTQTNRRVTAVPQDEAVAVFLEKFEVVKALFHGFDYKHLVSAPDLAQMNATPSAINHILGLEDGKKRFLITMNAMMKAFALSVPHDTALALQPEVKLFQIFKAGFIKITGGDNDPDVLESAIRQIVSKAVAANEVIDIFSAAGLKNPDISILSDEFLEDVKKLPYKNVALELLRKLINDEIKLRQKQNVVQARSFAEMLAKSVSQYNNRALDAAELIQKLIDMAKEMAVAAKRGEQLGLTDEEVAFYDALNTNFSAKELMDDQTLKEMAKELVTLIRRNVSVDWTEREPVKAQLRVLVKRLLRKYKYPPDKAPGAVETVLEQAEEMCREWVA